MLKISASNIMLLIVISFFFVILSIGICISVMFQKKKNKKYEEVAKIVESKKGDFFQAKTAMTYEEIHQIDPELDIDNLVKDLFSSFVKLQNCIKEHKSEELEDITYGTQTEFTKNRIKAYKNNGYYEIMDDIDLIESSITEFTKEKLKLRATIECFNYKMLGTDIVSGSNLEKFQEIIIIEYENHDNKWLITHIEKLLEKKLGN